MEAALAEAAAREAQAAKRLEEYNSMLKQLKSMIDSGKLKVRIVRNKMVIELPEAVLFASGSAKLKKEGVRVLAELGPVLASLEGREFQVGGHTDNKPIKTKRFPSNWELSGGRCNRRDQAPRRVRRSRHARLGSRLRRHPAGRRQRDQGGPRAQPPHRDRASAEPRRASRTFRSFEDGSPGE